MKLLMPRTDFVLEPSVFLASLFSLASVKEQAVSMTPILAIFSTKPSVTLHEEPNFDEGYSSLFDYRMMDFQCHNGQIALVVL